MNVRKAATKPSLGRRVRLGFQAFVRMLAGSLVIAAVGGLFYGLAMVYQWLDKPIAVIAVEGEFQYIKQEELEALVVPVIEGGIVSLNLGQIAAKLETNPWIKSASVFRRWPDGVVIKVIEESPIARWGKQGFLNSRGELLHVSDNRELKSLPLLEGEAGKEFDLMRRYREMAQLLSASQLKIQSMKVDTLGFWTLQLVDGPQLVFGVDDAIAKARRFIKVWNSLPQEQARQMAQVDLRYGNGLAVQWTASALAIHTSEKNFR